MPMRTLERWESELSEDIWNVIEETARDKNIPFEFLKDSKEISEAVNTIRSRMNRLNTHVKSGRDRYAENRLNHVEALYGALQEADEPEDVEELREKLLMELGELFEHSAD